MPQIHISVSQKIAHCVRQEGLLVCGNSDYEIFFTFDSEWNGHEEKTARFIWNDEYYDVNFTGDRCPVPIVVSAAKIEVGVYAGTLRTTTPAIIRCRRSIRSNTRVRANEEAVAAYNNAAQQAAAEAKTAAEQAAASASYVESNLQSMEKALDEVQSEVTLAKQLAAPAAEHAERVQKHVAATREVFSFTVGKQDELLYMTEDSNGVFTASGRFRYNNYTAQTIYRYPLSDTANITSLVWHAHLAQQPLLQASLDGQSWTTLQDTAGATVGSQYYYELADILDVATSQAQALYIRIGDSNTADGNGGAILSDIPVTLEITRGVTLPFALPSVTAADDGAFLRVINGRWLPTKGHALKSRVYTYAFTVGSEEEAAHITSDSNGRTNSTCRFNDGSAYTTYRYHLPNAALIRHISFTATMGQQLRVSCSSDGVHFTTVFDAGSERLPFARRTLDLTDDLNTLAFDEVYVRISDSTPSDGFGGAISLDKAVELHVERCEAPIGF